MLLYVVLHMTEKDFFKTVGQKEWSLSIESFQQTLKFYSFIPFNEQQMPIFHSRPTYTTYHECRKYFQQLKARLKQNINLSELWIRIRQYIATDF